MMLEIDNLSFCYPGREAEILEEVSFEADAGDLVFILGENGAGKTTLFRCLLGLIQGYKGKITLNGQSQATLSSRQIAKMVAYVPQAHQPTFGYTVADMVLMGTNPQVNMLAGPGDKEQEAAAQVLRRVGIEHLADRRITELSGGERQLVLIARAMAQKAKILVMDEPTASLDYGNQYRVLLQIQQLARQGYLVVCSSHNPEHALRFGSKVLLLQQGRKIAYGPPEQAMSPERLEQLYGLRVMVQQVNLQGAEVPFCIPVL